MNAWVGTWNLASSTHRSYIALARQFVRFAMLNKWLSPAAGLIKPAEDREPKLPFTVEEEEKLFAAAARFGDRRHFDGLWAAHPQTARALMLVMRWTGLRASDAVRFELRRIKRIQINDRPVAVYGTYQQKTKAQKSPAVFQIRGDFLASLGRSTSYVLNLSREQLRVTTRTCRYFHLSYDSVAQRLRHGF